MVAVMVVPAEHGAVAVRARFRLERRLFGNHFQTQRTRHGIEHVVVPVAQPTVADL